MMMNVNNISALDMHISSVTDSPAPVASNNTSPQGQKVAYPNYQTTCVRNLSITVIVIGCLCILFQVVDIFLRSHVSMVGAGIWGGILFIIPGVFGLQSVKLRTSCMIGVFLGLAIFGALISLGPITAGSIGAAQSGNKWMRHYFFDGYQYPPNYDNLDHRGNLKGPDAFISYYDASVAMNALMAIAALVGAILLVLSSAYGCHGLCLGNRREQIMTRTENNDMSSEVESRDKRLKYQTTHVRRLSISVIAIGCMCVLFQFIDIFLRSIVSTVGTGIWGGVMMIISGVLGLQSVKQPTSAKVLPFLVLAIFGAILSIAPVTAGFIGVANGSDQVIRSYSFEGYHYPPDDDPYDEPDADPFKAYYDASVAMNALMALTAVVGGILLLISCVYACLGLCSGCRNKKASYVLGQVQYITGPNNQEQMVIIPLSQPVPGDPYFLQPGQQVVVTNPTSAPQAIYVPTAPGEPSGSSQNKASLPPAYDEL